MRPQNDNTYSILPGDNEHAPKSESSQTSSASGSSLETDDPATPLLKSQQPDGTNVQDTPPRRKKPNSRRRKEEGDENV